MLKSFFVSTPETRLRTKIANSNEWVVRKCENLHFSHSVRKIPILDSFFWAKQDFFKKEHGLNIFIAFTSAN